MIWQLYLKIFGQIDKKHGPISLLRGTEFIPIIFQMLIDKLLMRYMHTQNSKTIRQIPKIVFLILIKNILQLRWQLFLANQHQNLPKLILPLIHCEGFLEQFVERLPDLEILRDFFDTQNMD